MKPTDVLEPPSKWNTIRSGEAIHTLSTVLLHNRIAPPLLVFHERNEEDFKIKEKTTNWRIKSNELFRTRLRRGSIIKSKELSEGCFLVR